jgi:hypothetical protein
VPLWTVTMGDIGSFESDRRCVHASKTSLPRRDSTAIPSSLCHASSSTNPTLKGRDLALYTLKSIIRGRSDGVRQNFLELARKATHESRENVACARSIRQADAAGH